MSEDQLIATGLAVAGLGVVIRSVVGIMRRRLVVYGRGGRRSEYTGRLAVSNGIFWAVFGLIFIVTGCLWLWQQTH